MHVDDIRQTEEFVQGVLRTWYIRSIYDDKLFTVDRMNYTQPAVIPVYIVNEATQEITRYAHPPIPADLIVAAQPL